MEKEIDNWHESTPDRQPPECIRPQYKGEYRFIGHLGHMGQARHAQRDDDPPRSGCCGCAGNHVVTDLARYHSSLGPIRHGSPRRRS